MNKLSLFSRFSSKEQTLFAKRLAFLVRAGVPLVTGLQMIKKQMGSKRKTQILEFIIADVESGKDLATSLSRFRTMFGGFTINIVRAGESGGILHQNLNYLAEELKKRHALKKKVVGALVYPLFIMAATLVVAGLLVLFVFPKIIPVFKSLQFELPLSTKILLAVSSFLLAYGLWLILGVIVCMILFGILNRKVLPVRRIVHTIILHIPLLGKMVQTYQLTNFTRTLGLLLKSGIRITSALTIVSDTTENVLYREAFLKISDEVATGRKLSSELTKRSRLFTALVPEMVAIGETSGNLSETLLYLSDMYENELDELTRGLSNAIEPVLMIFMGLIVGFIAISIITPIYGITQSLSR